MSLTEIRPASAVVDDEFFAARLRPFVARIGHFDAALNVPPASAVSDSNLINSVSDGDNSLAHTAWPYVVFHCGCYWPSLIWLLICCLHFKNSGNHQEAAPMSSFAGDLDARTKNSFKMLSRPALH